MTTVAVKDGVMAADTQITSDYAIHAPKLFRLPDGGVAGGAGDWSRAYAGIKWLMEGERGDPPNLSDADILILRPDGSIWKANEEFPAYPLLDKVAAIGCGSLAAMVAMRGGASAVEAVMSVAASDVYTNAPVMSMTAESVDFSPASMHVAKRKRK